MNSLNAVELINNNSVISGILGLFNLISSFTICSEVKWSVSDYEISMNPENLLNAARELPGVSSSLRRLSAEAIADVSAATTKSPLLQDLARHFPSLTVEYPAADQVMMEPIEDLTRRFKGQHQAILEALHPADNLLPHLGFHGTSEEGGSQILGYRRAGALDFATSTIDGRFADTRTYVSGVGRAMETAVSFSEKWGRGYHDMYPGPVFVMDIGAADRLAYGDVPIRHPYGGGEMPEMAALMGAATNFKGTIYNLNEQNFSSILAGKVWFRHTQRGKALIASMNRVVMERIDCGSPRDEVLADLHMRANIVEATRRLDFAHQAISKWLETDLK